MRKVILIWEEVPETTKVYDLLLDEEEYEKILNCHRKYINTDLEVPELEWLSEKLEGMTEIGDDEPVVIAPAPGYPTTLIVSGFIL